MKRMLLAGAILVQLTAFSQNNYVELSLKDAQQKAISENIQIKNAELNITASEYSYSAARAKGLPQAQGSLDYANFFNYELNLSFGSSTTPTIDYTLLDAGDAEIMKLLQSSFSSEPIIMAGSFGAKFQVTQLLFNGQYWVGLQTAKLATLMQEQNLEKNKIEILETVSNVYFGILILEESIAIIDTTIQNLQDTRVKTSALVKAGLAEATDTIQIRIVLNTLENNQKQLERSLEFNYNMLRVLLHIPQNTELLLTEDAYNYITEEYILSLINTPFSIQRNIDYQMIETQEEITGKMIDLQKMAYAPTAAAFYTFNPKFVTTGIDMNPTHMLGVSVQIPIFSSGERYYEVKKAEIQAAQVTNSKDLVKEQVEMMALQAQYNLKNAYENYLVQKENLALALNIYEKIKQKYEYGVASSFELLQANNSYLEAQSNYLQAYMQLFQSINSINKLSNNF